MTTDQKAARLNEKFRELSDQELNKITKAVAEQVRAQTVQQKEKMKTSLRREIDAVRTAFRSHEKKGA